MELSSFIIPLCAFLTFVISLILSHKSLQKSKYFFIGIIIILNITIGYFTVLEKFGSKEKMKNIQSSITTILEVLKEDNLKKYGFTPDQISQFIDTKDQLNLLSETLKSDSLLNKVYADFMKSCNYTLKIIPGCVDSSIIKKSLRNNTSIKVIYDNEYKYLTPNTIYYTDNLEFYYPRSLAYTFVTSGIKITSIEKIPFKGDSFIEIGFSYPNTYRKPIDVSNIHNLDVSEYKGSYINFYDYRDSYASIPRPVKNFKAYEKLGGYLLVWDTPNQTEICQFELRSNTIPITQENFYQSKLYGYYDNLPPPLRGKKQEAFITMQQKPDSIYFALMIYTVTGNKSIIAIAKPE